MKVYVVTEAEFLEPEVYITVKTTKKDAEKFIRAAYPNAREDHLQPYKWSYLCIDKGHKFLKFITEETI